MGMFAGLAVFVLILSALVYIRLAPSDPARWHISLIGKKDRDFAAGATRVVPCAQSGLQALHQIALSTDRTQVLAGDPSEGHVTYITRSLVFGFPDYTSVQWADGALILHGRLRFGVSDFGVNHERLEAWVLSLGRGLC
jgi:uncharacterized protein (DUF1499 family)